MEGIGNGKAAASIAEPNPAVCLSGATHQEVPLVFPCQGEELLGILHRPESPGSIGLLVVVGGPQYRVGSHRQFLLLARGLARHHVAVFRFDYRGMGDSSGDPVGFERCGPDIGSAIDAFFDHAPWLEKVVLWGLCDAASAISFYAHQDARVAGVVLLNPWVRSEESEARARVKHYYRERIMDREFWEGVLTGAWDWKTSLRSFAQVLLRLAPKREKRPRDLTLSERMARDLGRFKGRILFILSGDDLTAHEFKESARRSATWSRIMTSPGTRCVDIPSANHTFSSKEWRNEVASVTLEWLLELEKTHTEGLT